MQNETQYVVRVEGLPYSYGLGEVVSNGVAFFKAGNYDLTHAELNAKLKQLGKAVLR